MLNRVIALIVTLSFLPQSTGYGKNLQVFFHVLEHHFTEYHAHTHHENNLLAHDHATDRDDAQKSSTNNETSESHTHALRAINGDVFWYFDRVKFDFHLNEEKKSYFPSAMNFIAKNFPTSLFRPPISKLS